MTRRITAVLGVVLAAACGDAVPPAPSAPALPDERAFLAQLDKTRGSKDCFDVLVDPPFVAAAAAPRMRDDELVVGLDLGSDQVCYPVQYLDHHEIVEHRLAGLELLACW